MSDDRWFHRVPTVGIALRNLRRTGTRSALATLGIVIGVVAIAALGMFGTALEISATENLSSLGNEVTVTPADDSAGFGGGGTLDERQLREIRRIAHGEVVPVKESAAQLTYQGEGGGVRTMWVPDATDRYEAARGRMPASLRSGVLVGSRVARQYGVEPGNAIAVGDNTYRVVAVLESEGFVSDLSPDFTVVVPRRQLRGEGYSSVVVEAENATRANATATELDEELNRREEVADVRGGESSFQEQVSSFYDQLNLFLLGIGSISLLVAGVSILNVMLMSTVERRGEIGVMRAVGFRKRDVLKVLLSEATLLGVIGGLVGLALSLVAGGLLYLQMLGDPLVVFDPRNFGDLALAFGFAIVTSLVSGAYPAWKAANEHPVDALRS